MRRTSGSRAPAPPPPASADPERASAFAIIGIGASAGGIEALQAFFRQVPPRCGAAFVVVQHLAPRHEGVIVDAIQRVTPLAVGEAVDGDRVEPDHVYVIPRDQDMSLVHGSLHLLPTAPDRGRGLPIDLFLCSLAEDQGERSVGVILSGMGTDGTLGLRAIKEAAGAAFVQSPASAKFDGMPRSAIDAGVADVVAPVEDLPARILAYRDRTPYVVDRQMESQGAIESICALLRERTGNDFLRYKRRTIEQRIERRLGLHQLDSFTDYLHYLRENPREVDALFNDLLIGVTSFFRDPAEWERLREELPALLARRAGTGALRAWVAGCATGEEAYSLAIVLAEAIERVASHAHVDVLIFATDLDREAIEHAHTGLYPESIAADITPERLGRFFVHEDGGYRVTKELRDIVVFAPQNVIVDPPFTKVDLVLCRNVMIYLSADVQRRLIPQFHDSLNPGGVLFLGTAETIGSFTNLFASLDGKTRLYIRLDPHRIASPLEPQPNVEVLVDRLLLQRFAPVGILCDTSGHILYISGRSGKYLEPAVGEPNVFAMAREGLRRPLSTAFASALQQGRAVTVRDVEIGSGDPQHVDITVQKLSDPEELSGTVLVVIADVIAQEELAATNVTHELQSKVDELSRALELAAKEEANQPALALDRDLVVVAANPAAERLLADHTLVGRHLGDLRGAASIEAAIRSSAEAGELGGHPARIRRDPDGTIWLFVDAG